MEDTNNLEQAEREELIKEKQELLARLEVIDQLLGISKPSDLDAFRADIMLREMEIRQREADIELREKQIHLDFEARSADIQKHQEGLDALLKKRRDELEGQ